MRTGLDLAQVQRLTPRLRWQRWSETDELDGAGAYCWIAHQGAGDLVYAGESSSLRVRLRSETRWSVDADHLGIDAFSRLVSRLDAAPFYVSTAHKSEARDLQALIGAANVHSRGCPPLGWGLAWAPRSARAVAAWERALSWAEGEIA